MKQQKRRKKVYSRSEHGVFSVRMRVGIKSALDEFCINKGISRNNFVINSVLKELSRRLREEETAESKKKSTFFDFPVFPALNSL